MNKAIKGFIRPKKIWTKKFSQKEIKEIWRTFIKASPLTETEWAQYKKPMAIKYMSKNGLFIHPETDIEDNAVGIEPKHMKVLLEQFNLKEIEELFCFMNSYVDILYRIKSSDGFIEWDEIIKIFFAYSNQNSKTAIGRFFVMLILNCKQEIISKIEDSVYLKLSSSKDFRDLFAFYFHTNRLNSLSVINTDNISQSTYIEERMSVWRSAKNFTPKTFEMLRVNPNNFDTSILKKIEELFGTKQMANLSTKDKLLASFAIEIFGINLKYLNYDKEIIISYLNSVNEFQVFNINKDVEKHDLKPILEKFQNKISIKVLSDIIYFSSISEIFQIEIKKLDLEDNNSNMQMLEYLIKALSSNSEILNNLELLKVALLMPIYFWKTLQRFGDYNEIIIFKLLNLFLRNRNNDCLIPNLKGSSGEYRYEVLRKNDPMGLILGYATDCCQVFGHAGESCLINGYTKPNSTFFAIYKGKKVVAQAWVWITKTHSGETVFCFDSIEVLGRNLNLSNDLLKVLQIAIKDLKKVYDLVVSGADGSTVPDGLFDLGKSHIMRSEANDEGLVCPFHSYTDTEANGFIVF